MCREETGSSLPEELALLLSYLGEIPDPPPPTGTSASLGRGAHPQCAGLNGRLPLLERHWPLGGVA
jgi:hypothetical protein